ncbi:hypothetical protein R1flu_024623 [Riccia fluitans]|uniref:Uncharacterized protein n=1 Tax=Riccia fluitans TaxID=41844 RepID=A0ABD1XYD5_9MARC
MAPCRNKNLKTKEVKIPHLMISNRKKMETWGEAVKKTVARQIKGLGVCNETTCLGPYLAHLYNHFHEMDPKEKEASKKRKASV